MQPTFFRGGGYFAYQSGCFAVNGEQVTHHATAIPGIG